MTNEGEGKEQAVLAVWLWKVKLVDASGIEGEVES